MSKIAAISALLLLCAVCQTSGQPIADFLDRIFGGGNGDPADQFMLPRSPSFPPNSGSGYIVIQREMIPDGDDDEADVSAPSRKQSVPAPHLIRSRDQTRLLIDRVFKLEKRAKLIEHAAEKLERKAKDVRRQAQKAEDKAAAAALEASKVAKEVQDLRKEIQSSRHQPAGPQQPAPKPVPVPPQPTAQTQPAGVAQQAAPGNKQAQANLQAKPAEAGSQQPQAESSGGEPTVFLMPAGSSPLSFFVRMRNALMNGLSQATSGPQDRL